MLLSRWKLGQFDDSRREERHGRAWPHLALLTGALACGGGGDGTGPDPNEVASVVVSPSASTLTSLGATTQFTATARNSSGGTVAGKAFTWSSTSASIADVSASGLVTAVGAGTTTVRATVSGGTASGTAQVTVQQAVTSVAIAPSATTVAPAATLQLSATARDAGGAAVAGATYAWTSSNIAVATVNASTGLVTGVAVGTTNVSVASGGQSAQRSITVINPALNIAKDTTISGTVNVDGFSIAAGFTVTVSGPLNLHSNALVSISGTLTGNCTPMEIVGDTAIVITGTVKNGCGTGVTGVPLRIAATGELTLSGALIESSGQLTVANSPSLSAFTLGQAGPMGYSTGFALNGIPSAQVNNSTIRYAGGGAGPNPAPSGTGGANGTSGAHAVPVYLLLNGNVVFGGNTLVWAQDGGDGGDGTNESTSNLTVNAGNGGNGGLLRLFVGGTLTFNGSNNILRSGRGGHGGDATAGTQPSPNGNSAPSATATAGNGGSPGLVEIEAAAGIFVNAAGALAIEVGKPGDGGDAIAGGAAGEVGTASKAPQAGGNATATGGHGGGTPNLQLIKQGAVTGSPPLVRAAGGGALDGGRGGMARATGGQGGAGFKPNKTGATGGAMVANAGNGGAASLGNIAGLGLGTGGNGGLAWFIGGAGGAGWDGCVFGAFEPGGAGGVGGPVSGSEGLGGSGRLGAGTAGGARFDGVSNGGAGANGKPNGTGGSAGAKAVNAGVQQHVGTAFTAGQPGSTCPVLPNVPPAGAHLYMPMAGGWGPNSQGQIGVGPRTRTLLSSPGGAAVGDVSIATRGVPTTPYYVRTNVDRIGQVGDNFWDLNVASVRQGTTFPNVESFTICFLNEDPVPSGPSPIYIEQRDNFGVIHDSDVITGPGGPLADGRAGCRTYGFHMNATHVRWYRAGTASSEVDWITFTIKLTPFVGARANPPLQFPR